MSNEGVLCNEVKVEQVWTCSQGSLYSEVPTEKEHIQRVTGARVQGVGEGGQAPVQKNLLSADRHCYDIGQNDTINKIELFPSSDLLTRDQNC